MQTQLADLSVIGGGVAGLSVAYEAARRGFSVMLIESRTIGSGATGASAGVVYPLEALEAGSAFDPLVTESLKTYPAYVDELAAATGLDCGYRRPGLLDLEPDDDRAWLPIEPHAGAGVRLDADAQRWLPGAGRVEPASLVKALTVAIQRLGVTLIEGVGAVESAGQPGRLRAQSGGRYSSSSVVVAAGAWSAAWQRHNPTAAQVQPVRGQMLKIRPRQTYAGPMIRDGEFYLAPTPDGDVICGSTVEDVAFDARPTADGLSQILAHGRRALEAVGPYELIYHWSGLRPSMLAGARPLLGPDEIHPWLHWATGYYRLGMTIAPAAARRVVDGVLGR